MRTIRVTSTVSATLLTASLIGGATFIGAAAAACSAAPPAPEPVAPPGPDSVQSGDQPSAGTGAGPAGTPTVDIPPSQATGNAPATAVSASAASKPSACGAGMKLIEGDYCTKVQQKCLIEWWAPQNRKRVCEQFQPPTKCVGKRVPKRFCIDTYSYPNKKGERPEVMNHFYQAQVKCAAMGKRMCTESEWNFACEGPDMKPFPHGYVRDPKKCNGDHKWDNPSMKKVAKRHAGELARLWRGVPSGSQPDCVSDFGVADLPSNNDEVVAGESHRAKYSSVHTGGPWYSGVRNQCRPKVYTHEEGFYYYFLGFRCCSEPDGKPSEPRTKKQIRGGMPWKSVERLASFTVEQMQQVLQLKKEGRCECKGNELPGLKLRGPRWLCKTMCGTLLGPGAKNADDSTRVPHKSRHKID